MNSNVAPSTFWVSDKSGAWSVYRGEKMMSVYHSRGDAIRAACFTARYEDKQGRRARVVAMPGDEVMPHYEAHFGI
ncbi:MAG: hypothetical protein U1C74_07495 [Phenylobacterium sp.]|nr:hypothetical protein [Phenylobacterium sp.]